jgi:hypothetical protein
MKHASRRAELVSISIAMLLMAAGLWLIRDKVRVQPSTSADLILTPDEIRSLPKGTLPVVLVREYPFTDSRSLAFRVLRLVLDRSGATYVLGFGTDILDSPTSLQHLGASVQPSIANPSGITVGLYGAIEAKAPGVTRINRPVGGGLLGLRVLCVNQRHQDRFAAIQVVNQLKPYLAIQGLGWGDADVLTSNGLPTLEVNPSTYLALVDQDRVDYLPRSLTSLEEECGPRAAELGYPEVSVDRHLLLAYPNAWTFAVNSGNTALQRALTLGYERAYADGSLKRLVEEAFFTPWLKRTLNLPARRLVVLSSPQTEAVRQAIPERYWNVPWDAIHRGQIRSGKDLCREAFFAPLC